MNPLLSILLPNYNHAKLLPCAITSALSQSFTDFELIIIDDGSTDESLDVIQHYLKQDSRIQLIQHEKNRGIAEGIKSGLKRACGRYLHMLSATDCYLPGFLEQSLIKLCQFPEMGLSCTNATSFDGLTPCQLIENAPSTLIFPPAHIQQVFKYAHFTIPGLTAIIKRDAFLKYGGYRENLLFLCDTFLNHQVALEEGVIYIPETLVAFREPGYSKSCSSDDRLRTEALNNLRELLLLPQQQELLLKMRRACVLGYLCKKQLWACLKDSKLRLCYLGLIERYLYKRFRRLMGRPLVSIDFLRWHSL